MRKITSRGRYARLLSESAVRKTLTSRRVEEKLLDVEFEIFASRTDSESLLFF